MNTITTSETKTDVSIYRPRVGMHFLMRGCEFEVCFTEFGMVRFATTKGGKPNQITVERFKDYQETNEITILNPELNGQDQVGGVASWANLSQAELDAAMRKTRYAQGALAELVHPNSKAELAKWIPEYSDAIKDEHPPSPSSVSEWVRKLRFEGVDAFKAPERKRGNRLLRFSPEMELLVLEAVDTYLQEENRDANDVLAYIVGKLAEQNLLTKDGAKVAVPCTRTIRRILHRIDPFLLARLKKGRLYAERMARAAGKSIVSSRPLMLAQIDTHFLKVFVVDPVTRKVLGKPYLCCVFDVKTRCVVGRCVSLLPASTTTTLSALKNMFTRPGKGLPGGIPINIVPDNGVEFRNTGVENLLRKFKVHLEPATARDPNGKAHIESFFRNLSLFLIQKIKGTTFSNPEKRGDYPSEKRAYATLAKIEEYVDDWIENQYHLRRHSATGRIPIQMWREETANTDVMSVSEEEVTALARRTYVSAIRNGRVRVARLSYFSHALKTLSLSFKAKVVVLVDELDLSHVLVEHPFEKGVLIQADSTNPEYTAQLSMWEHKEAMKIHDQMTQKDLRAVGKYAFLLARYRLLVKLQEDSEVAKSLVAKIATSSSEHAKAIKKHLDDALETQMSEDLPVDEMISVAEGSTQPDQSGKAQQVAGQKDKHPPERHPADNVLPEAIFMDE